MRYERFALSLIAAVKIYDAISYSSFHKLPSLNNVSVRHRRQ